MKKISALFIIGITLMVSCNNNEKEATASTIAGDTATTVENKIMIPKSSCYESVSNKDSVKMKVEVFENVVTGTLAYKFYQKDSNKGEFEGTLKGDTLLADYTFMSEGTQSVRQVVFLIKDETAIEGYGDIEEKDGKMVFKNLSSVVFGKGIILKKVECNY